MKDIYWKEDGGGFYYLDAQENGYVSIGEEQHKALIEDAAINGRVIVSDVNTGLPVLMPIPEPTYQQELFAINADWQEKVETYNKSFALAALSYGPSEESKKAAIRAAYETDKAQNTADRAALKVKHGIGGV